MDIYEFVGKRIREQRTKTGLTLEELAEASSISTSFLAYIERGKKKASLETIRKLADGLQIQLSVIFSDAPVTKSDKNVRYIKKLSPLLNCKEPKDQQLIYKIVKILSKSL